MSRVTIFWYSPSIRGMRSPNAISTEPNSIPIIITIYPGRFVKKIRRLNLVLNGILVFRRIAFLLRFLRRSCRRNFSGLSFSLEVSTRKFMISIITIGITVDRMNAEASQTVT